MSDLLGGDFPETWDDFVGQATIKRQLRAACRSAKARGAVLDHVLLATSKPGMGKTSLALLCAAELGREVKVVSGKITPTQARIVLSDLSDGDVLIYDEIHMAVAGGKANAEGWLLHLLQNGCIAGPNGEMEEQPDITVIGCTTDEGRLPETIVERFKIKPPFEDYSEAEAAQIAASWAGKLFPPGLPMLSRENAIDIGRAALRSPRKMSAIISALRDIAVDSGNANYDGEHYDLTEALEWVGLTADGLDDTMRRYLVALLSDFGGAAGERALNSRLGTAGLANIERALVDKGYVAMTRTGRSLTKDGIKKAKELRNSALAAA